MEEENKKYSLELSYHELSVLQEYIEARLTQGSWDIQSAMAMMIFLKMKSQAERLLSDNMSDLENKNSNEDEYKKIRQAKLDAFFEDERYANDFDVIHYFLEMEKSKKLFPLDRLFRSYVGLRAEKFGIKSKKALDLLYKISKTRFEVFDLHPEAKKIAKSKKSEIEKAVSLYHLAEGEALRPEHLLKWKWAVKSFDQKMKKVRVGWSYDKLKDFAGSEDNQFPFFDIGENEPTRTNFVYTTSSFVSPSLSYMFYIDNKTTQVTRIERWDQNSIQFQTAEP